MKIKNFLRKGTAVICAAVLVCGFVLPAFSSLAGTNEVDITTSTTMENAHTGWFDGCWTVFIDPGDYTIASAELADGTSSYFYINNHENVNNVDMAEYILINGVSVRDHINSYTGSRGSAFPMSVGAVYNPILVDTFQPYDNIRVSVLSDYIAMADLTEVTLKAGFSWANTKGETLKVTKDVTYTYAADGTATRKVEEIKKIGWNDFGVTADTTYQDGMTALSYDGTTLNNTEFEGDITFSAQSELRYGGAGEWLGLQLSVDNSGRFRIVEGTYAVETIGGWSWPENLWNERVFAPADLGITEYGSFAGQKITLNIKMEEVTDTTAKVTISIDDKVVGGAFRMTSKDTNTYKTGNKVGMCGNAYGEYNPITAHVVEEGPEIKKITWKDFGLTTDTVYKDGLTDLTYSGGSLDNTEFEGDITFSACSELRYGGAGGWLGLQLSVDNSGRFRILEGTYALEPIGGWSWPENPYNEKVFTPADLRITEYDSFAGKRITLKIKMEDVTETTAKVTISINDKVVGGSFRMTSKDANTYKTGKVVGMCGNAYGEYNPITAHVVEEGPEIKKITWKDFGVTAETTYKDTLTALSYDGTSLDNTEFEGGITFSACSELRYGGSGEWLGLQLSVDNSGRFRILEGTYALDPIGGWSWPENLYNERVFTPADLGITEYESFAGQRITLKIKMEEVTETTAKVTIHINDKVVGGAFRMTSKDANTFKTGKVVGMCGNAYGEYNPITAHVEDAPPIVDPEPPVTDPEQFPEDFAELTHLKFGIDNGEYAVANGALTESGEVTDRTTFDKTYIHIPKITFIGDVDLNFFGFSGWEGFKLRSVQENGTLAITSGWGQLLPAVIMTSDIAGVNLVGDTYDLKITVQYKTENEIWLGVWFNDVLYNNTYIKVDLSNKGSDNIGLFMGISGYTERGGKVRLEGAEKPQKPTEPITPPTGLKTITLKDFGGTIESRRLTEDGLMSGKLKKLKSYENTMFDADVDFATSTPGDNTYIRFGGDLEGWLGLSIQTRADGSLAFIDCVDNRLLSSFQSQTAGVNFYEKKFNLKVTFEYIDSDNDGIKDDLRLGVYFNNRLYDNEYVTLKDRVSSMTKWLLVYTDDPQAHPLTIRLPGEKEPEPISPDADLKEITFTSFGIEDADFTNIDTGNFCASGVYRDLQKGKTLEGTLFHGKVKFGTVYGADIRLGGTKDGWSGLRLATVGDGCLLIEDTALEEKKLSKMLSPAIAGTTLAGKWLDLMMSVQYVDSDGDGKKDDVKLGIWFDGVLYENKYIYIADFAESMGSYMGIYSSNPESHISIRSIEVETYIDLALFGFDDNYASRFKTTGDYYVAGEPRGVTEAPFTGEKRSSVFWYMPAVLLGMIFCVCMRRYKKTSAVMCRGDK